MMMVANFCELHWISENNDYHNSCLMNVCRATTHIWVASSQFSSLLESCMCFLYGSGRRRRPVGRFFWRREHDVCLRQALASGWQTGSQSSLRERASAKQLEWNCRMKSNWTIQFKIHMSTMRIKSALLCDCLRLQLPQEPNEPAV